MSDRVPLQGFGAFSLSESPPSPSPARPRSLGKSSAAVALLSPSSTGGGVSKTGVPVGLYFVGNNPEELCRGLIQGAGVHRFCLKATGECRFKSHQKSKAGVHPNAFYIQGQKIGTARLEPYLIKARVPPGDELDVATKSQPAEVWDTYIRGVNAAVEQAGDQAESFSSGTPKSGLSVLTAEEWEDMGSPTLKRISMVRDNFASGTAQEGVAKGSKTGVEDALLNAIKGGNDSVRRIGLENCQLFGMDYDADMSLEDKFKAVARFLEEEIPKLDANDEELSSHFERERTWTHLIVDEIYQRFKKVAESILEVDVKARLLEGKTAGLILEDLASLDAVERLEKAVLEQGQDTHKLTQGLQEQVRAQGHAVDMCQVELSSVKQDNKRSFDKIEKHLVSMGQALDSHGSVIATLGSSGGGGESTSNLSGRTNQLDALRAEVDEVKALVLSMEGRTFDPNSNGDFVDVNARLDVLETKVTTPSIQVYDFEFDSTHSIEVWLEQQPSATAGVFWDLFGVMVSMMEGAGTSGKEYADRAHSSKRIGETWLESTLLASLTHLLPKCLFKDGDHPDYLNGFTEVSSYEDWLGHGNKRGYRAQLQERMAVFTKGVRGNLKRMKGDSVALAERMLTEVEIQFAAVSDFMTSFYLELTGKANFKKGAAWRLIGRCVGAIFDRMHTIRSSVSLLDDRVSSVYGKAQVLAAMLESHKLLNSLKEVDFRAHPLMVKEINLFMLDERVDPSMLDDVYKELKDTQKVNDELRKLVAAQTTQLKKAEDLVQQHSREIKNLQQAQRNNKGGGGGGKGAGKDDGKGPP